jgi:hypothetical protein
MPVALKHNLHALPTELSAAATCFYLNGAA